MTHGVPEYGPRRRVIALVVAGSIAGGALLTWVTTPQHFDGRVIAVGGEIDALVVTDFEPAIGQAWTTSKGAALEVVRFHRQEDSRFVVSLRPTGPLGGDWDGDAPLVGTAGSAPLLRTIVEGISH